MAYAVSEWTTIGANSGTPSAVGLNKNIVAGTEGQVRHETVGHGVYDYDTNGKMPFMRIKLDAGSDANCTTAAANVSVTVVMHNV